MWPFKRKTGGCAPQDQRCEAKQALESAQRSLDQSRKEGHEARHIAGIVQNHLAVNHISQRIDLLIRSHR